MATESLQFILFWAAVVIYAVNALQISTSVCIAITQLRCCWTPLTLFQPVTGSFLKNFIQFGNRISTIIHDFVYLSLSVESQHSNIILSWRSARYYKPWSTSKPIIVSSKKQIAELSEASVLSQRAVYADVGPPVCATRLTILLTQNRFSASSTH